MGKVQELMLEYLKKNTPEPTTITSIVNMDIKMDHDYIGKPREHYIVDVRVDIIDPVTMCFAEKIRRCYVKKTAFDTYVNEKNNIIWEYYEK